MANLVPGIHIQHTIHVGGAYLPLDHWIVSAIQFATFGGKVRY